MRVVFVVDTVQPTNGVATSAQRAAATLRGRGHEVVVVATDGSVRRPHRGWIDAAAPSEVDRYVAQPWHIPVVSLFAQAQRFTFATPSRELLERAYRGADVVHIWLATPMGRMALQVAQKMGIPVSAGFHVQPENITYNIGLGRFRSTTSAVYTALREYFYEEIGHIHCPSQFIADQLADHGYRAQTHVISNGVTDVFTPGEPRPVWTLDSDRPLRIMSVGRLSP
ncbi:glycosyltransferase, partial [Cutibacterium granulosum]